MPSSRVTAGVRRKASTPLLKMGRPPSAAKGAAVCCGGAGVRCGRAVQNEELLERGGVEDAEGGWEGGWEGGSALHRDGICCC